MSPVSPEITVYTAPSRAASGVSELIPISPGPFSSGFDFEMQGPVGIVTLPSSESDHDSSDYDIELLNVSNLYIKHLNRI